MVQMTTTSKTARDSPRLPAVPAYRLMTDYRACWVGSALWIELALKLGFLSVNVRKMGLTWLYVGQWERRLSKGRALAGSLREEDIEAGGYIERCSRRFATCV